MRITGQTDGQCELQNGFVTKCAKNLFNLEIIIKFSIYNQQPIFFEKKTNFNS